MFSFELIQTDGKARLGRLVTPHGEAPTPLFIPVGTAGSVKGVTPDQLRQAGTRMVLATPYHLMLRPGAETVAALGGLHALMAWQGPLLTDSGGFQVFSLAHLRQIDDEGVRFQSHIDGSEVRLTPERAVEIQRLLGADVMMQLDECPPARADRDQLAQAVRRTAQWARRCKAAWQASPNAAQTAGGHPQALFGIQQGGVLDDLRRQSARQLVELDLSGYAVGGLSVGEGPHAMAGVLDAIDEQLPADRPRYLMGVGEPRDMLSAVLRGIDMFDCVLPTRNARNAQAFTWTGRIRLRNSRHAQDRRPLEETCTCYTCRNFSRGTLRHLFMAREMLAATLLTIHNLRFFADLTDAIRSAIAAGNLLPKAWQWIDAMYPARSPREDEE